MTCGEGWHFFSSCQAIPCDRKRNKSYICGIILKHTHILKTNHTGLAPLIALCALPMLSACDWFDYHPYCVDISGETFINSTNAERIEALTKGRKSFRFALISDTQRWYDDTEDLVRELNSRTDIDFIIHAGDLTDFGVNKEFLWQRDILSDLNVPYTAVIGNHDCLGTGKQTYSRVWGDLNYAFTAGDVRFICINSNALEFDYSRPVPDLNFLYSEMDSFPEECDRTIIVQHCRPFDDEFNNNIARFFHEVIKRMPGFMFSVSGHTHRITHDDLFDDGVIYHSTTCVNDRAYLIFDIQKDGYTYEVVTF